MNLTCANNTLLKIGVDYFKELQRSQKPSNSSVCTGAAGLNSQKEMMHVEEFSKAAFGSSIFIIIVSPMTIVANSLLLVTFLVDPLKIFRNPTSYFLIGLAIVDLLTALIQEPIYATCFMLMYFQHPSWTKCKSWMKFTAYFSAFPISISASIIFAFTLTQYIVVASPLRYGRMITKKKALALLLCTSIIRFSVVCLWWVFRRRPNTPSTYSFTGILLFSSPSWYTLFCITPWKRKWNFQLTIQLFTKLWRLTWKKVHWERGWEIKQFKNMVMTISEILWNKERSLLNSQSPTLTMNNILPTWIAYKLTFNLP